MASRERKTGPIFLSLFIAVLAGMYEILHEIGIPSEDFIPSANRTVSSCTSIEAVSSRSGEVPMVSPPPGLESEREYSS